MIFFIASEGMIYKYTVKMFKMFHPDIKDDIIVREVGILDGVERNTHMAQCHSVLSQVQRRDEHHT